MSLCPIGRTQDNLPPLPNESAPPQQTGAAPPPAAPPAAPSPNVAVPPSLTIPAGTLVTVRLIGGLSSDVNQQGDSFSATLAQPIVVDGWVVARPGQIAVGDVVSVQKAGRVKGVSSLGIALSELPVVDGRQLPVASQLVQTSAGTSKGRDALGVATTTGLGAAIGGAVDGGAGAGIGAAAGVSRRSCRRAAHTRSGRRLCLRKHCLPSACRSRSPSTLNIARWRSSQSISRTTPVVGRNFRGVPRDRLRIPPGPGYPYAYSYPYPYPYPYPYAVAPYWGRWGYPSVSFYYGRGYWGPGRWH